MEVSGEQLASLDKAIRSAFIPARFTELLLYRLNKNLYDIAYGDDYKEVVFKVLRTANAEGWLDRLVLAVRSSHPDNAELQAVAAAMNLSSSRAEEGNLERIVIATGKWSHVEEWRAKLGSLEDRVCRVEVTGTTAKTMGTGFLIGPRHAITNYHVVDMVIDAEERKRAGKSTATPNGVVVRFDYKRSADGKTLNEGRAVALADAWLLDSSPPSPVDEERDPKSREPSQDELDYAVLELAEPAGTLPIGRSPEPEATQRGWISLSEAAPVIAPNAPLFMLQHPATEPLQLAIGAAQQQNGNETRVRYTVNSLHGSSGAPVFDDGWALVALHHAGDPNFDTGHEAGYNEGVPMNVIRDRLTRGGFMARLAAE